MQQRPYATILTAVDAGVLTVTLNRPDKRNAIGTQMVNELLYVLEDAEADDAVEVVVVTGAGKAFCAGGDFSQFAGGGDDAALPPKGDYRDLLGRLWRSKLPVIARVNGHAMGGGLGLVAACTFAIASTDAKLGTPEVNVGLFPFMIAAVLERVMGRRALYKMMLFGERYDGAKAAELGLVNEAVAPGELDAAVKRYTDAVLSKSPLTLRLGLMAMADTEEMSLDEKLPVLAERLVQAIGTDDAREGLAAFFEKRKPNWTGK